MHNTHIYYRDHTGHVTIFCEPGCVMQERILISLKSA